MLSNAYLLAKFRFDTAENEPAKNLQKFANFANLASPARALAGEPLLRAAGPEAGAPLRAPRPGTEGCAYFRSTNPF